MHKLIGVVFVALQLFGCSQIPTLRQSESTGSHYARVGNHIVQQGDGSSWVFLFPPGPSMAEPVSVTPGPDGNMWFAQEDPRGISNVVGKIDMSGVITEYLVSGAPIQIAIGSDGALWFDEVFPSLIGRITTSGMLTEYPIPFTKGNRDSYPYGFCSGPDGNLWFADRGTKSIDKVTTQGVFTEYRLPKPDRNRFPTGITSGPDGNVWFVDSSTNEIGRITPFGRFALFAISTPNSGASGIALGPDGHVYFAESQANKIGEITRSGEITEYALPSTDNDPRMITPGYAGNSIWFDDSDATTGNGQLRQFLIRSKTFVPPDVPPYNTVGLDFMHSGLDGNMWIADSTGRIAIFLTHVLTAIPASVIISGVGQSQTIQIHETQNKGGSYTAVSSDQSIATVSPVSQSNSFVVTAQGVGSCSIRVSDSIGNYIDVPVTVQ